MIKTIFHIADIHIRLLKRHKEYKHVFNNLYKILKERAAKDSVIVLAGDIFHSKTELSPEVISMGSNFLSKLCNIMPVIMIAGNHDGNLSNINRLDALSPIVKALGLKNLYYFKDTGIYDFGDNIQFAVISVFNKKLIRASELNKDKIKIALYHGIVNGSMTDLGYELTSDSFNINSFKGYDLVLLGDIHKQQYLNDIKTIAYPSSLIQQNHGEKIQRHGFLQWNLETKKSKFIEVPNDYGYVTIKLKNGIIQNNKKLPLKPRIRLLAENTEITQIKEVIKNIKKEYDVQEVVINKVDNGREIDRNLTTSIIDNIRDAKYQNKLINQFLKKNFDITSKQIREVKKLNIDLNDNLSKDVVKNIYNWKIKKLEFSNLFSYGENNVVDFEKINNIVGLLGPNHIGKSALVDVLLFTLFDKCSRAFRGKDLLNSKKNKFYSMLNFEIDGVDYFIKRIGKRNKKNREAVRIEVDFWKINSAGEKESLNGTWRRGTDENIKEYIGQYEDFTLTSVSLQNDNTGFIDMAQTDRNIFLSQLLKLNTFDELYQIASQDLKELSIVLKEFQKDNIEDKLIDAENELEENTKLLTKKIKEKNKFDINNKEIEELYLREIKKLKSIEDGDSLNIEEIKDRKQITDKEFKDLKIQIKYNNNNIKEKNIKLKTLTLFIESQKDINIKYKAYQKITEQQKNLNYNLKNKKNILSLKLEKLEKLKNLEYDPNCKYCMNNIFVKDAIETKKLVDKDKKELRLLVSKFKKLSNKINQDKDIEVQYNKYIHTQSDILKIEKEKNVLIHSDNFYQHKQIKINNKLKELNEAIDLYKKNKSDIDWNSIVQKEIDKIKEQKDNLSNKLDSIKENIQEIKSDIKIAKIIKKNINNRINEMKQIESRIEIYNLYLKSIGRDGIPYTLISETIPIIEEDINNILALIADFSIMFELDGKNINLKILYDEDTMWAIELASGFEKFITSLAIRMALTKISHLAKPNFLAIDEGFGNFDSENISNIGIIFNYLKTQFDFILVISHIDILKGAVDQTIDIRLKDNYSYINV